MNILWLSWRDIKNPTSGGAEKLTFEVAKRFVRDKSPVTIFSSSFHKSRSSESLSGVKIIRAGNLLTCRLYALVYYLKNRSRIDVVIDEVNTIPFFTPVFAPQKSVCFIHQLAREYWFSHTPFPVNWVGYLLEPLALKLYRNRPTITVSNSTKEDLLRLGFSKIKIIREGIDLKPFLPKGKKKDQIVFIGRLVKAKCPEDAILAFNRVNEIFPNYKLIMVGAGQPKYLKSLKNLVNKHHLVKKITFTGYVKNSQKNNILKNSKVALIPSIREGWSLVATEANSQGCVPIAYNVPGLKDSIKNHQTGILTSPDPKSLAKETIKLLIDNKKLEELAKNGHNWSKNFTWENSYQDCKKFIYTTSL